MYTHETKTITEYSTIREQLMSNMWRPPMTDADIVSAIVTYGLMVRQVPKRATRTYEMRHYKAGDCIVEHELTAYAFDIYKAHRNLTESGWRFDEDNKKVYRRYVKRTTVPEFAGYWMCKQYEETSSAVKWSYHNDNLAPTLAESIQLFLKRKDALDEPITP